MDLSKEERFIAETKKLYELCAPVVLRAARALENDSTNGVRIGHDSGGQREIEEAQAQARMVDPLAREQSFEWAVGMIETISYCLGWFGEGIESRTAFIEVSNLLATNCYQIYCGAIFMVGEVEPEDSFGILSCLPKPEPPDIYYSEVDMNEMQF